MSLRLAVEVGNAMLMPIGTASDAGKIEVYDGAPPAGPATAVTTQVKLCEFFLAADAFPDPVAGVLTLNPATSGTGLADGTAAWFRLKANSGTALIDGDVSGPSPGDGDLIIDDPDIVTGRPVAIQSLTLSMPLG